jgi:unsaturated rhamnogalacturonyl hydrolase
MPPSRRVLLMAAVVAAAAAALPSCTASSAAARAAAAAAAPPLPSKADVLAAGLRAASYWLNATNSSQACGWEDSTFMLGLGSLQQATSDAALLSQQIKFGERYNWTFCDGRLLNPDFQVCGASYAQAYVAAGDKGDATWLAGAVSQYEREMADRAPGSRWSWVDAVFMAVSVYARLGAITGDRRYFDHMTKHFDFAALSGFKLWSPADGLFFRDPPAKAAEAGLPTPPFWARGNGWGMGALATALEFLPAADPHRAVYADLLRRHAARLAQLQGRDGCWRVSLADPEFYDLPEATGTSMFAYGIAYGVDAGLLARGAYLPVVERAWQCLSRFVLQPSGRVGYCQPGGAAPHRNFNTNSTSAFCVGQFLMAASAVSKLAV